MLDPLSEAERHQIAAPGQMSNKLLDEVADYDAEEGYVVLVPDLFWRQQPGVELGFCLGGKLACTRGHESHRGSCRGSSRGSCSAAACHDRRHGAPPDAGSTGLAPRGSCPDHLPGPRAGKWLGRHDVARQTSGAALSQGREKASSCPKNDSRFRTRSRAHRLVAQVPCADRVPAARSTLPPGLRRGGGRTGAHGRS